MRIFKNRTFCRWAAAHDIEDTFLRLAVDEMERGLVDTNLGGHVFKKRLALRAHGKSRGARTLLVYHLNERTFFVYGFTKSARDNVGDDELIALKRLAKELLAYSDQTLNDLVLAGALIEVIPNE